MKQQSIAQKAYTTIQQLLQVCRSLKQENKAHSLPQRRKLETHKKIIRYHLGKSYPGIYLSQREAECVALLLEGYGEEKSAKILDVSPYTIERYLRNVREKIYCKNNIEIIQKIQNTDFISKIPQIKQFVWSR